MKRAFVTVSFAVALGSLPAFAQSAERPGTEETAILTPDQDRVRHGVNETHEACIAEADTSTLTGEARHSAIQSCYWRHRDECVRQAASEGLPLGAETHDFVRDCLVRGP
jgi:hypothetical protein